MTARAPSIPRSRRRLWLFRVLAVMLGLLPVAIAEATLWALGLGTVDAHSDPFALFPPLSVLLGPMLHSAPTLPSARLVLNVLSWPRTWTPTPPLALARLLP